MLRALFGFVVVASIFACDGINNPGGGTFDAWTVLGPSALIQNNELLLWYYGAPSIQNFNVDLGLATVACNTETVTAPACRSPGPLVRSEKNPLRTEGGNPLGKASIQADPSVLFDTDHFRMWFTSVVTNSSSAASLTLAYAESGEGLSWSDPVYDVLSPTPGTFDVNGIETPSVVAVGNQLKLYYTGNSSPQGAGSSHQAIGLATSTDGVHWNKVGTFPVLDGANAWENGVCGDETCSVVRGGVGEPSVVFDGSKYHLWYAGLGELDGVSTFRIGYATSNDGVVWARQALPVLEPDSAGWDSGGVSQPNVVVDPNGFGLHMFYFGFSSGAVDTCSQAGGCAFTPGSIGHAFSVDGITWTKDSAPILSPP